MYSTSGHGPVSSDYKTTADHLPYPNVYDNTRRFYTPRENDCDSGFDSDTRFTTEFDSGRTRHTPKRSGSEFVLGSSSKPVVVPGVHPHPHLKQSYSSYLPSSSGYRTHSDQVHLRQEMIAPNLIAGIRQAPQYPHNRANTPPVRYVDHQPHASQTHRRLERNVPTHQVVERKRSVSPQMKRQNPVVDSTVATSQTQPPYVYSERKAPIEPATSTIGDVVPVSHIESYGPSRQSQVKNFKRKGIDMTMQSNREDSFVNQYPSWSSAIPHLLLVLSGFFFTGQEDIVKCFSCLVEIGDWKRLDDIHERHFIRSPNCHHLRKEYLKIIIDKICPVAFEYFTDFGNRFKSLHYWPISGLVSGRKLAEAGFFYQNEGIRTQCYRCGVVKDNWKAGDDPFTVHLQLCKDCPHMKEFSAAKMKAYKIEYKSLEDRLMSFKNMSVNGPVKKEELAIAGFVLIQPPFTVQCPECEVVVDNWMDGEDPLIKHMKLNSNCPFIKAYSKMQQEKKEYELYRQNSSSSEEEEEQIQLPPSYKSSVSTSSNDSVSLPTQSSLDKEESLAVSSNAAAYKRSVSTKDDNQLCIVCFENLKECAIVPCGHLCVCKVCADKLQYCPICRHSKQDVLKIFIP